MNKPGGLIADKFRLSDCIVLVSYCSFPAAIKRCRFRVDSCRERLAHDAAVTALLDRCRTTPIRSHAASMTWNRGQGPVASRTTPWGGELLVIFEKKSRRGIAETSRLNDGQRLDDLG